MGKLNHGLAITLAASLAALGCTTNQNLGNGTPTRSGPEVRTAPTSGVTSGGETYTPPVNPPMTSSYNRSQVLPTMKPRLIRRSPDEAAAILAGNQPLHGRYLGVVSPGAATRVGYQSDGNRNYVNPALQTNPQLTVNSSISSQPNEVINTTAEGAVVAGTTAAATIPGTATPTTAATTLLPTFASAGNPTVTAASVGLGRTPAQAAATTTTTAPTTATTAAATTRVGAVTAPVRIIRNTGTVTVTNVGTTTTRNR